MNKILLTLICIAITSMALARDFHVAVTGDNANDGSAGKPLKTIQAAANVAQSGDVITVHTGLYRERIDPPRGGTSDANRITYQAAPGEKVVITGAEAAKGWVKMTNDTWRVTLPASFFGAFNPYSDRIRGDWCKNPGGYHTGAVYLNGDWLTETPKSDAVMRPAGTNALWFASVDTTNTTLLAQFPGVNPNEQNVEINVRQTVFTPSKTGINYLTVRGFELRAAAAPWAPPTAAQTGIISAYWCKGWIIENNTIRYSPCSGVVLGKYGDEWDNGMAIKDKPEWLKKEEKGGTGGYTATTERALTNGWNREAVGSHVVRGNEISHCEQAGIVGSLGCAFSTVTGNSIHDIHTRNFYSGYEMAGIKFHGGIDVLISHNHFYRCRGYSTIWLDWMGQGSRITGNLMHDNGQEIFLEMQHGPILIDNNLCLSKGGVRINGQGVAFAHNVIAGPLNSMQGDTRITPFQRAHSTKLAGMFPASQGDSGDHRFYNNLFFWRSSLQKMDDSAFPCFAAGNVFIKGPQPAKFDTNALVLPDFNLGLNLVEKTDGWYLTLVEDPAWRDAMQRPLVTTALLGKAKISDCIFDNPDGSPVSIDTDYFGKKRDAKNPFPGPFEDTKNGSRIIRVWPKP